MAKKKLLVFHLDIAPYRVDLWNELNNEFAANFYYFRRNVRNHRFDMRAILDQLNFNPNFFTCGFELYYKGRMVRFGYLKKIIKHRPDIIINLEFSPITIVTLLFSNLFFPHTKVYSICDDSLDISKNCSGLRLLARSFA